VCPCAQAWVSPLAQNQDDVDAQQAWDSLATGSVDPHDKIKHDLVSGDHRRTLHSKSLGVFHYNHPLRRFCRAATNHWLFEGVIVTCIVANCIMLAMSQPMPNGDNSALNDILDRVDVYFLGLFTLELVMKVVASGVYWCGSRSYLRSGWNMLDATIVVAGLVTLGLQSLLQGVDITFLRGIRVIRPLRLITSVQSLQVVMISLWKAIPGLTNVAMIVMFLLIIFTIISVEFYRDLDTESESNPAPGIVGFGNGGIAFLTILTCVTLEGWTDVLVWVDSESQSWANFVFFLVLIVLGAFIAVDLAMGVLSSQFTMEGDAYRDRARFIQKHQAEQQAFAVKNYREWVSAHSTLQAYTPGQAQVPLPGGLQLFPKSNHKGGKLLTALSTTLAEFPDDEAAEVLEEFQADTKAADYYGECCRFDPSRVRAVPVCWFCAP